MALIAELREAVAEATGGCTVLAGTGLVRPTGAPISERVGAAIRDAAAAAGIATAELASGGGHDAGVLAEAGVDSRHAVRAQPKRRRQPPPRRAHRCGRRGHHHRAAAPARWQRWPAVARVVITTVMTSTATPSLDRSQRRRREVCDAARRVIARNGLEVTTLRDISREGGFTTGVVTHYFPDKQAVIVGAFAAASDDWLAEVRDASRRSGRRRRRAGGAGARGDPG